MSDLQTVIIVCDTATVDGGLGKVAVTSALGLRDLGLAVVYFCPLDTADPRLAEAGVEVVLLGEVAPSDDPSRIRGMWRGIWNARAAQALRDLCAKHDPVTTIVHCHGYSKALSPAIGPVLTKGPIPCVYTMHEYFLACPNGGFFDFPRAQICTRKPMGLSCLTTQCDSRAALHKGWRVVRQAALWGPGQLPRKLDHVIAVSHHQAKIMAPYLGDAALHHVPNPVDFQDAARVPAEDNDIFLFIGRLEPDKGALDFAKAAVSAGVKAVFVGTGRLEDEIKAILPDATITGWLDADGVANWLDRARAMVFPSLWYETFGLVAYEALKRGVPVIAGGWNAASDAISNGKTGVIYDKPSDLECALRRVTATTAGEMSQAAYASRDKLGLTPSDHAQALCAVYAKVLGVPAFPLDVG